MRGGEAGGTVPVAPPVAPPAAPAAAAAPRVVKEEVGVSCCGCCLDEDEEEEDGVPLPPGFRNTPPRLAVPLLPALWLEEEEERIG